MAGAKGRSGGARPNTGGARPGAGRKKKEPILIDSTAMLTSDPKQFLTALMNDAAADIKIRADAAKALLAADLKKGQAKGKKVERQEAADKAAAVGRFAAAAPPLRVVGKR